jgi:hypothetical protein
MTSTAPIATSIGIGGQSVAALQSLIEAFGDFIQKTFFAESAPAYTSDFAIVQSHSNRRNAQSGLRTRGGRVILPASDIRKAPR